MIERPTGTEPEGIAFTEHVTRSGGSTKLMRGGAVLGSALLLVVGAVAVMGASPSTPAGADPSGAAPVAPSDAPRGSDHPGRPGFGFGLPGGFGGFGGFGRGDGGHGFGAGITITAIDGSKLSLKTADGWTRTIDVASGTTISRAGKTIAIGDLKVGDAISFREQRGSDGTYTIKAIDLILPSIAGQITKIDGSTITVKQFDGTAATIHVSSTTTYGVAGVAKGKGALSDLKVDGFLIANGTKRADGSLDAESVFGGSFRGGKLGQPFSGKPNGHGPKASPQATTTPG